MRYKIKEGQKDNLLDGRRINSISSILGASYNHIAVLLRGEGSCTEMLARCLVSIRKNVPVNDEKMDKYLAEFFKEEK